MNGKLPGLPDFDAVVTRYNEKAATEPELHPIKDERALTKAERGIIAIFRPGGMSSMVNSLVRHRRSRGLVLQEQEETPPQLHGRDEAFETPKRKQSSRGAPSAPKRARRTPKYLFAYKQTIAFFERRIDARGTFADADRMELFTLQFSDAHVSDEVKQMLYSHTRTRLATAIARETWGYFVKVATDIVSERKQSLVEFLKANPDVYWPLHPPGRVLFHKTYAQYNTETRAAEVFFSENGKRLELRKTVRDLEREGYRFPMQERIGFFDFHDLEGRSFMYALLLNDSSNARLVMAEYHPRYPWYSKHGVLRHLEEGYAVACAGVLRVFGVCVYIDDMSGTFQPIMEPAFDALDFAVSFFERHMQVNVVAVPWTLMDKWPDLKLFDDHPDVKEFRPDAK